MFGFFIKSLRIAENFIIIQIHFRPSYCYRVKISSLSFTLRCCETLGYMPLVKYNFFCHNLIGIPKASEALRTDSLSK